MLRRRKLFAPFKTWMMKATHIKHIDLFSSDHTHFFFQKQNKMVYQTLEKNGMASRAVFRIIISEISIWLFRPLGGFNTSSITFLGLKQKWQKTLSSGSKQKRVLRQWVTFNSQCSTTREESSILTWFFWKLTKTLSQAKKQFLVAH